MVTLVQNQVSPVVQFFVAIPTSISLLLKKKNSYKSDSKNQQNCQNYTFILSFPFLPLSSIFLTEIVTSWQSLMCFNSLFFCSIDIPQILQVSFCCRLAGTSGGRVTASCFLAEVFLRDPTDCLSSGPT